MARLRVVILSGRSLFTEGVASRLRQDEGRVEVITVDSRQPSALADVVAARPAAVILDAMDADIPRNCPLGKLLAALPSLTVLRLDPQQAQVQVVTSEQRLVSEVRDLLEIIAPSVTN